MKTKNLSRQFDGKLIKFAQISIKEIIELRNDLFKGIVSFINKNNHSWRIIMTNKKYIGTGTQFCAVIGNPVAHSLSPAIHNAAYEHLGLDFVYVASRVEDVKGALAGMRALSNFRGLSVTIPHKIEVMKYLDEISDADRAIGSINTVVHEGDRLIGLGTDGPGAMKALADAGVELKDKNILILGAGGAARAISFTLAIKGGVSRIILLDINEDLLSGLKNDLNSGTKVQIEAHLVNETATASAMAVSDIIINCTSVGMHPNEGKSIVPPELFRHGQVAFDIVYTPLETKLLKDAKARGLKTIQGVEMFVNQAALQFERFTGHPAPVDVMRIIVLEKLNISQDRKRV
jgi:shikimate dehydrogenase